MTQLRILGSALAVYGYYLILFQDLTTGVLTSFVGNVISVPWFIRNKCWDVVFLLGLVSSIELARLIL